MAVEELCASSCDGSKERSAESGPRGRGTWLRMARRVVTRSYQKSSMALAFDRAGQHVMGVSLLSSFRESSGGYNGLVRKVLEFRGPSGPRWNWKRIRVVKKMKTTKENSVLAPERLSPSAPKNSLTSWADRCRVLDTNRAVDDAVLNVTEAIRNAANAAIPTTCNSTRKAVQTMVEPPPASKPKRNKGGHGVFSRDTPPLKISIEFKRAKALARRILHQCQRESSDQVCVFNHIVNLQPTVMRRKVKVENGFYRGLYYSDIGNID
ncbi:hypothetical protein TNCV_4051601 [Trichonephila clavipes]|nr:hypothetical protein TNCV_4051601 [Trichonephila clavipes]